LAGTFPFSAGTPGTDGATTINAATLVGSDTLPRQGMYALRGQGCALALLADTDDATQWSVQAQFGISESVYMILTGPAGDTITHAAATKAEAGIDTYAAKMMFGDWVYWYDQANAVTRLVSPQGFVAGRLANLSPEQSSLNKQIYGVIGTQKSGQPGGGTATTYATADLSALLSAGIDVISNPQPGGAYWGVRGGHNASSNAAVQGDNYTRLTNYIASTLSAGMGQYVGQLVNSTLFQNIRATLLAFLNGLLSQGLLGSTDGSLPFAVVCDTSNNPASRTGLGYVQADVQVQYQAINEKFIVNVQGGQTVQVSQQLVPAA
jgi:phage tail sheath protein FI